PGQSILSSPCSAIVTLELADRLSFLPALEGVQGTNSNEVDKKNSAAVLPNNTTAPQQKGQEKLASSQREPPALFKTASGTSATIKTTSGSTICFRQNTYTRGHVTSSNGTFKHNKEQELVVQRETTGTTRTISSNVEQKELLEVVAVEPITSSGGNNSSCTLTSIDEVTTSKLNTTSSAKGTTATTTSDLQVVNSGPQGNNGPRQGSPGLNHVYQIDETIGEDDEGCDAFPSSEEEPPAPNKDVDQAQAGKAATLSDLLNATSSTRRHKTQSFSYHPSKRSSSINFGPADTSLAMGTTNTNTNTLLGSSAPSRQHGVRSRASFSCSTGNVLRKPLVGSPHFNVDENVNFNTTSTPGRQLFKPRQKSRTYSALLLTGAARKAVDCTGSTMQPERMCEVCLARETTSPQSENNASCATNGRNGNLTKQETKGANLTENHANAKTNPRTSSCTHITPKRMRTFTTTTFTLEGDSLQIEAQEQITTADSGQSDFPPVLSNDDMKSYSSDLKASSEVLEQLHHQHYSNSSNFLTCDDCGCCRCERCAGRSWVSGTCDSCNQTLCVLCATKKGISHCYACG
ncbi:unnamed protein product, partial [Amoebophrya sp. A25]